jgi:hypothetical protein
MFSIIRSRILAAALGASAVIAASSFALAQSGSSSITGTLEVIVKDDFDRGHSERAYFVRDQRDDALYELQFDRTPPGHLRTGRKITVRGRAVGRRMEVDSLDAGAEPTAPTGDAEIAPATQRRSVVILVDMIDAKASSRYTVAQITANMFTGARSVDGLFQASSQGQLGFQADTDGNGAPDVFGRFTINESGSTGDYYAWAYAAGVDLSLYQHRVFVLRRYNDLNISWAGIANVGCDVYCRS